MYDRVKRAADIVTIRMMAPNFTQAEIAAHIGIHVNTVNRWGQLYAIPLLSRGDASKVGAKRWKRMWGITPKRRTPTLQHKRSV